MNFFCFNFKWKITDGKRMLHFANKESPHQPLNPLTLLSLRPLEISPLLRVINNNCNLSCIVNGEWLFCCSQFAIEMLLQHWWGVIDVKDVEPCGNKRHEETIRQYIVFRKNEFTSIIQIFFMLLLGWGCELLLLHLNFLNPYLCGMCL